jgi:hypothetical protein
MSGRNRISRSSGTERTTSTAFEDVQQMSDSAFTAALVFTYATTTAPGCSAFQARTCSAVMPAASEQPAPRSGRSTVLSGDRILAVSAMKWTPQKTIVSASVAAACRDSARESPTKSATSWIQGTW